MCKSRKKITTSTVIVLIITMAHPIVKVGATPHNNELIGYQNEYITLEKEVEKLNENLQLFDNEIELLIKKINENTIIIEETEKNISNILEQKETKEKEIDDKKEILGLRFREFYKSGGQLNLLLLFLSNTTFQNIFDRISSLIVVVKLDKEIIKKIESEEKVMKTQLVNLGEQKDLIIQKNTEIENQKKEIEDKKISQQELIAITKEKQKDFDNKFLAPKERAIVKPQLSICLNKNSTAQQLNAAIQQLQSLLKSKQIISEEVIKEVKGAIKKAREHIINKNANSLEISDEITILLNEAYKHLGKTYVWGAKGPNTFDCSGFTSYVYRHALGIEIGVNTYVQINSGKEVSYSQLQPGDLVFPHAGHVGIYVGNGQMIHAPRTGDVVKVAPVYKFWRGKRIVG